MATGNDTLRMGWDAILWLASASHPDGDLIAAARDCLVALNRAKVHGDLELAEPCPFFAASEARQVSLDVNQSALLKAAAHAATAVRNVLRISAMLEAPAVEGEGQ